MEEADALDLLPTISLLHRRLDAAHVTPSAPSYGQGGLKALRHDAPNRRSATDRHVPPGVIPARAGYTLTE